MLYIDDLDRCSAKDVVKVLQAVNLLLTFKLFVVVIGVDGRWLEASLSSHYDRLLRSPVEYLEKIIQLPFVLRPMSPDAYVAMVGDLTTARVRALPTDAGQGGSGEHGDAGEDRYSGSLVRSVGRARRRDRGAHGRDVSGGCGRRGRRTAAAGSAAGVAGHQRARTQAARQGRRAHHDPTDHEAVRQHLPDGPGVRGRHGRGQVQPGRRRGVPSRHRPARRADGLPGREGDLRPDHERRPGRRRVDADEDTAEATAAAGPQRAGSPARSPIRTRSRSSRSSWTCRLPAPTSGGSRWCRGSPTTCRRSSLRRPSRSRPESG